ncbi:MAG: SCP2 domain-containing protein [Steroidobacteraceae bacterium]
MSATPAWLAAVEALLNRGVQASMPASALARRLDATSLRVDIEGVLSIRASVTGGRLSLVAADRSPESAASEQVNATIAGSPFALLQLAGARGGASGKIPHTPAQVRGDAEIANLYRQLFAVARPDLEEELSRIVGDLAARRLSQFARQTAAWVRHARRTAGENIAEYLQEESRVLVNKTELEEFLQGVDMLRETADRVEARIARLEQRLKGSA